MCFSPLIGFVAVPVVGVPSISCVPLGCAQAFQGTPEHAQQKLAAAARILAAKKAPLRAKTDLDPLIPLLELCELLEFVHSFS